MRFRVKFLLNYSLHKTIHLLVINVILTWNGINRIAAFDNMRCTENDKDMDTDHPLDFVLYTKWPMIIQKDLWSFAIFSAIEQLVVSSLVSFWRLGPYLFNKYEKTIWWRLIFRDTEPWRDSCFKCSLAESRNVSRSWYGSISKKHH